MYVSARELRIRLKYYLDVAQKGEQVDIIRNSAVIARIVGADVMQILPEKIRDTMVLPDGREVMFRQLGRYEDPEAVHALKPVVLEFAQDQPAVYYENLLGEFWLGEIDTVVMAYGGYLCPLEGDYQDREVVIRQVYVAPELVDLGVEGQLRAILTARATERGYKVVG